MVRINLKPNHRKEIRQLKMAEECWRLSWVAFATIAIGSVAILIAAF
jgi:hypothetical protein